MKSIYRYAPTTRVEKIVSNVTMDTLETHHLEAVLLLIRKVVNVTQLVVLMKNILTVSF